MAASGRKEQLQNELNLQNQLVATAKTHLFLSEKGRDVKEELLGKLKEETDLGNQITDIQKAIDDLLLEQINRGDTVNQNYIDQLDRMKEILELKKQQKDKEKEINDLGKEFKDSLLGSLGTMGDMLKAGTAFGAGMVLAKKATEMLSSAFESTVGLSKELYVNFGLSAGESAEIALQTAAASFSIEGMLYGTEAMAEAAKSSIEYFGTISNLTLDSQKNIATLNKLGVDATKSVQLDKIFADAAGDGSDLTDSIKVIAKKEGVTAKKLFEGMTDDMSRLVGATEDEIKAMAQTNAQLIKRGLSMKQLEDISDNVLNVEQSMRAEAKARAFLGRDINANGVRQAALALQTATTENGRNAAMLDMSRILEDQVGSAEDFNDMSKMQRNIRRCIWYVTDGISEMLTKQEQFNEYQKEYAGLTDAEILKQIKEDEALDSKIMALKEMGSSATSFAMALLPALVSVRQLGGSFGGITDTLKGMGGKVAELFGGGAADMVKSKSGKLFDANSPQGKMIRTKGGTQTLAGGGSPIETEVPGSDDVAPKAQGSEGGLKSLAEGLKAMGDGKVFAGIGAVALAGPAFIIALPSIPFLLFMGKVKLKQLEDNFTGLATGLNSMSTTFMGSLAMGAFGIAAIPSILSIPFLLFMGKVSLKNLATNFIQLGIGLQMMSSTFMGSLALAAFGVAALIAIPSLLFLAGIALLGAVGAAGLIALGSGLAALGGVAATGLPFIAIALIAALGVAMIPFGIALMFATPAIEAFGNIIIGVMGAVPPIIEAIANGFVTMMGALSMENIGALFLLGPALMLASVGMIAFSAAMAIGGLGSFFGGGLIDDITALAMIGPQLAMAGEGLASITTNLSEVSGVIETLSASLSTMGSVTTPLFAVAAGLYSIAGGLVSVAGAGLLSLPIIGGLIGLAAVAPALQSLGEFFGMGGDSESSDTSSNNDSNKELIAEIKGLRSDLQAQPIVLNVDGKVVSKISRVQSRQNVSKQGYGG
jgi:hypothetical protein